MNLLKKLLFTITATSFLAIGSASVIGDNFFKASNPKEEEKNWGGIRATPFVDRYSSSDISSEPLYSTVYPMNFQAMTIGDSWKNYRGETTSGDAVTVAVIDSGIDIYHEDFLTADAKNVSINASNVLNYSILDPKSCYIHDSSGGYYTSSVKTDVGIKNAHDTNTYDEEYDEYYSHGTASAACIGAAVNGVGGWGIAPKVNLLIIRCDFYFTSLDVAIRYAANNGADVINMSLGAYAETFIDGYNKQQSGSSVVADELENAISYAHSKDVVVVAAAGNEKTDHKSYPACNTGVVGVGALGRKSSLTAAGFSNFNLTSDTQYTENNVDVMAPGYVHTANVNVETGPKSSGNLKDTTYYETSGTSFACPLTAGAIALARAKFPDLNHEQIEQKLFDSCYDMGNSGWDKTYGFGRVDITSLLTDTALESVSLSPSERNLSVGDELQLTVSFEPEEASNKDGMFMSNDENIATVDEASGLVTAVGEGTTTIGFIPDDTGVDEAYMTVNVGEDYWTEGGEVPAGYDWELVSYTSQLVSGDDYIFVSEAASNVNGALSGSYLTAVSATISDHKIDELPEGANPFTLTKNGNSYTFRMSLTGNLLGYTGTNLNDGSGTTTWSITSVGSSAEIMGGSNYLSYNASSPRWKTYAATQGTYQIYHKVAESGGEVPPEPVVHTLSPIAGDSSVEVDSKITLSTSCSQSDTITWTQTGTGSVGFGNSKLATATGNTVDVYGVTAGSVTITATCAGESSVTKTITVTEKVVPPEPVDPTGDGFYKVTTDSELTTGEYLIVCENQNVAFDGSLTTLDAVANKVSVSIDNGYIAYSESLAGKTFSISSSTFSIQSKSGYYIGNTSNDNALKTSTSDIYDNAISIDNGDADIISANSHLRYNATDNQTRFRFFKSSSYTGQKAIQLYKLEEEKPDKVLDHITASYTGGDIYVGGSLDTSKLTVTAYFTDDYYNPETVTTYTLSDFDNNVLGEKTITVTYILGEVTKTATFSFEVIEDTLVEINATCSKTYYVGETISASDFSVTATYSSGEKNVENYTISPADYIFRYSDAPKESDYEGTVEIAVSALGKTDVVEVHVVRKAYEAVANTTMSLTHSTFSSALEKYTKSDNTYTGTKTVSNITYYFKGVYLYTQSSNKKYISFGKDNTGEMYNTTPLSHDIVSIEVDDANYGSNTPVQIGKDKDHFVNYDANLLATGSYRYFRIHYTGMTLSDYTNIKEIKITLRGQNTVSNVSNFIMYRDENKQCETKLYEALVYLNNCSSSDIDLFFSSDDYIISTARERLEAWALNQGVQLVVNNGQVQFKQEYAFNFADNQFNLPMLLVISLSSIFTVGTTLVIRKREK